MSAELIETVAALRKRYATPEGPEACSVCGGPMELGAAGRGVLEFHCADRSVDTIHWSASEEIVATGDPRVMDVLAALEASSERERKLEHKLRMIVSHATGGSCDDISLSVNDISCRITAHRNAIYRAGQEAALAEHASSIK